MRLDQNLRSSESGRARARNSLSWFCDAKIANAVGRVDAVAFEAFVVKGNLVCTVHISFIEILGQTKIGELTLKRCSLKKIVCGLHVPVDDSKFVEMSESLEQTMNVPLDFK